MGWQRLPANGAMGEADRCVGGAGAWTVLGSRLRVTGPRTSVASPNAPVERAPRGAARVPGRGIRARCFALAGMAVASLATGWPGALAAQPSGEKLPLSRSYTSFWFHTMLTDNVTDDRRESLSLAIGRMHPRGENGQWIIRAELAGGIMNARYRWLDGYYGGIVASLSRAFSQSYVEVLPEFAIEPYFSLGGAAFGVHIRDAPTMQRGAEEITAPRSGESGPVGAWTVALGIRALPRSGFLGSSASIMPMIEVQRQHWTGDWNPRTYLRIGLAVPTTGGRLLPGGGGAPGRWWSTDPPPMTRSDPLQYRQPLVRPDLPHHVYGLWGEPVIPRIPAPSAAGHDAGDEGGLPEFSVRGDPLDVDATRDELNDFPDDFYLMHHLGALHAARGEWDHAHLAWRHALEAASSSNRWFSAMVHADAAVAFAAMGWADSAFTRLELALENDPGYLPALINLGVLHEEQGRTAEAVEAYRRASEVHPESPVPFENLAFALVRAGRSGEALPYLARALDIRSEAPESARDENRWICAGLALYEELTGSAWSGRLMCAGVASPPESAHLLPNEP